MTPLHLVRIALARRPLLRHGRVRPRAADDEGYLVHAGLALVFADVNEPDRPADVPLHNFAIDEGYADARGDRGHVYILGYSDLDEAGLRARMSPDSEAIIRECVTRAVPPIEAGCRASYRTRVCPVVRTRLAPDGEPNVARPARKSRELDVWLAHRIQLGWTDEPPWGPGTSFARQGAEWREREEVYGGWLSRELGRDGASAVVEPPRMTRYQRTRLHRRKGDTGARIERPDVVLEGELEVTDAEAFRALLRRGVGRHRAFGFGTLLVRPA